MKKKFIVEVYELHCASFECEAETEEEAIEMYQNGQADYIEDSAQFIETADEYCGTRDDGTKYPQGIRSVEVEKEFDISKARHIEETDIISILKGEIK